MNSWLVGFVVAAFAILKVSCDPAGVDDKCKIFYVPNSNYGPDDVHFVGLTKSVTYYCLGDYYLEGHATLTCLPYGWDHDPPVCLSHTPINQCKYQLKELEYGFIDAEIKEYYNPGERIWYFCYEPYYMEGAQDVTCLPSGEWNYPHPICVLKTQECLRRDPPVNGGQDPDQPKYQPGDVVTYYCEDSYQLKGSPQAFCAPNGEWTHPVPECRARPCRDLVAPNNGYLNPEREVNVAGDMVFFKCFEHYVLVGPKKLTCRGNGQWNGQEPICNPITCEPLAAPAYGSLSPEQPIYMVKDRITFECDENFDLVGDKIVTCQDNGEFSGTTPECRPRVCDVPVIVDGSFYPVKTFYDVGDYVTFECDDKFELKGDRDVIHCLPSGDWSHAFPTCHPLQCLRPEFDNGSLEEDKPVYHVDDMVTFTCDMGFVLNGARKLTCLDNGDFSGPIPTCDPVLCERPDFDNGYLDRDAPFYEVGELVTFICDEGFTRVGEKKLRCLKTGNFNGDVPVCMPNMCDKPFIKNGRFTNDDKDSFAVDEMVVFSCDRGFDLVGIAKITCQSDSTWSDPFPTCIPILCERPNIEYGILMKDHDYYRVDEMVKISCERGFKLRGAPKLTCQEDGEFDLPIPTCEEIFCDRPDFNGDLDEDKDMYLPHETVIFLCPRGYKLVGESSLKCGFDGEWSGEFPRCERVKCPKPDINYGSVTPYKNLYHVDDMITFDCNDGFVRKGARKAVCQHDGTWTELPICKRVTCSPRPKIENGRFEDVQEKYFPGDMVKFFCDKNFFLVGEMKITCQNDGTWSDRFPTCEELTCPDPFLDNGVVNPDQDDFTVGDQANFVCNKGYVLVGMKKLTCLMGGVWSDDFPTCEEIRCQTPPQIDDGSFSPVEVSYGVGDTVDYVCDDGFVLVGESSQLTCTLSGDFSPDFPTCEAVTCDRPEVEEGVSFSPSKNDYNVGDVIDFKCRVGFTLVGSPTSECLSSGDFSDPSPTCEPNMCVQPEIEGGSFTPFKGSYSVGDMVSFSCDDGLVLMGTAKIRCLTDGEWSDDFPTCEHVECRQDPEIAYGTFYPVQDTYYYRDTVTFECNDGFVLSGKPTIKCLTTGRWSHTFPVCDPILCDRPQRNPNIVSIEPSQNSYNVGDEVTFRCQKGFKLVGSETSECQSDQTWSPVEPTCMKVVVCRPPKRPRFSIPRPIQQVYQVGDEITYKCREGFELKGDRIITCQDDGNFDPRPPVCKRPANKCRRPYTPRKLSITPDKDYYEPGEEIKYECEKPYQLDGDSKQTCRTNGRFSGHTPSCVYGRSDSCKHRCDEVWGRGQPCQCSKYCEYFDKETRPTFACCSDYEDQCKH